MTKVHEPYYAIIFFIMQNHRTALEEFMRDRGLSQVELAKAAKVSQSTVSRALKRNPVRYSSSWQKLFIYAELIPSDTDRFTAVENSSTDLGIKRITTAFLKVWDRSDRDAVAIANIVEALGRLRPERE